LLVFGEEFVPSVTESPNVTTAPMCLDDITSTPANQNHASRVDSTGMTLLAVKSPGGET